MYCTPCVRQSTSNFKSWYGFAESVNIFLFIIYGLSDCPQLTQCAAMKFFFNQFPDLQRGYSEYLSLLILLNLMRSKLSLLSPGSKLLIPCRVFVQIKDRLYLFQVQVPSSPNSCVGLFVLLFMMMIMIRHCLWIGLYLPIPNKRTASKLETEWSLRASRCSEPPNGSSRKRCFVCIGNLIIWAPITGVFTVNLFLSAGSPSDCSIARLHGAVTNLNCRFPYDSYAISTYFACTQIYFCYIFAPHGITQRLHGADCAVQQYAMCIAASSEWGSFAFRLRHFWNT